MFALFEVFWGFYRINLCENDVFRGNLSVNTYIRRIGGIKGSKEDLEKGERGRGGGKRYLGGRCGDMETRSAIFSLNHLLPMSARPTFVHLEKSRFCFAQIWQ